MGLLRGLDVRGALEPLICLGIAEMPVDWRLGGRRAAASLAVEDLFGQRAARLFVR